MPSFDHIPDGLPRPPGAVRVTEQFFGADGAWAERGEAGGRVELTYYDENGRIVYSTHGSLE